MEGDGTLENRFKIRPAGVPSKNLPGNQRTSTRHDCTHATSTPCCSPGTHPGASQGGRRAAINVRNRRAHHAAEHAVV
jgi:hypothetical protein